MKEKCELFYFLFYYALYKYLKYCDLCGSKTNALNRRIYEIIYIFTAN